MLTVKIRDEALGICFLDKFNQISAILLLSVLMGSVGGVAHAQQNQEDGSDVAAADAEAAQSGEADGGADDGAPIFTDEELDELVGWFALYPDSVVSQILIASTEPLDVVRASRWRASNPDVAGDDLVAALEGEEWDPSIKVLVGFPGILDLMAENLDETELLGNALIAQDQDLLDAVQRLRAVAQSLGLLESGEQITVAVDDNAIIIDPTDPDQIFLPEYDPDAIWETYYAQLAAADQDDGDTTVIVEKQPTETVIVEQPTTTTVVESGYSSGAVIASGLFGFTAGIIVSSLWRSNNYGWYGGCCYGGVNYHRHVHWHGGGVYRPGYRPGRPGYGGRPGPYWRASPQRRNEARRDLRQNKRINRLEREARRDNRRDGIDRRTDRRGERSGNRPNRAKDLENRLRGRGDGARKRPVAGDRGTRPGSTNRQGNKSARKSALSGNRKTGQVRRDRERGSSSVGKPTQRDRGRATQRQRPAANRAGQSRVQRKPQRAASNRKLGGGLKGHRQGGRKAQRHSNRGARSARRGGGRRR